jgi:hypothetical protein
MFWKTTLSTLLLLSVNFNSAIAQETSEASLAEDDLGTKSGVSWGGGDWPYSKTVEIKDSLVNAPVGKVVLDKHGIDDSSGSWLYKEPFSSPEPGKSVFISLWGSKIEGCFTELIVQIAPKQQMAPESIVPKLIELGINGQIVQITPQKTGAKIGSFNYTYTENNRNYSATWYMSRHLFKMDGTIANILASAPSEEVKARVTFVNDDTTVIPIGKGTVERWKSAYSFNPSCKRPK